MMRGRNRQPDASPSRRPWRALPLVLSLAAALALLLAAPLLTTTGFARGPTSVADIAETLQETVVNVSTTQTLKGTNDGVPGTPSPKGAPFEDFFDDQNIVRTVNAHCDIMVRNALYLVLMTKNSQKINRLSHFKCGRSEVRICLKEFCSKGRDAGLPIERTIVANPEMRDGRP